VNANVAAAISNNAASTPTTWGRWKLVSMDPFNRVDLPLGATSQAKPARPNICARPQALPIVGYVPMEFF
jgi:hypothetical protein